ncbi:solute carrier family 23 protein [Candidatus Poriferisodalis multihospitum]|uniref:solute carrier family 23 protein n=1 Tax=Candidatus Poriferisodalis multihospitum TaxID=2983191 RepID=UPI002B256B45|nr:solute carrier family 23 protein [Candidatus Poriferisodalis multihospitum]
MNDDIRFEPDERPPALLTLNVAIQGAVLIVTNVVTFIVIYSAAVDPAALGSGGSYAEWAVVGALLVAGVLTALHASRLGPGHLLLWGSGIPFMVPCILAVNEGGPALAASLAVTSSLLQLAMAAGLARLRRLITPVVAGVAFMMISLSAMPIAMRRPAGTRCAVARPSRCGQLARLRLHLRCRLLVAAAGVPGDQRRGGGTGHE